MTKIIKCRRKDMLLPKRHNSTRIAFTNVYMPKNMASHTFYDELPHIRESIFVL